MTIYDEVKGYLKQYPNARERKNKNRFFAWLLWEGKEGRIATKELIETFVRRASSYDRAWRQVLQHETDLRGSDYDDKTILEQDKELELGYQPKLSTDKIKL